MSEGFTLGAKALAQVKHVVRQVLSTFQNPEGHRARYTGATQPCSGTYDFRMNFSPASGGASFDLTYKDVTERITVQFDTNADELKALIDAHSQYVADGVESVIVDSTGDLDEGNIVMALPRGSCIRLAGGGLVRGSGSPVPEFKIYACR